MKEHTRECLKETAEVEAARKDYINENLNYCKKCGGWGMSVSKDVLPANIISVNPKLKDHMERCSHCIEEGVCPRCGEESIDPDAETAECNMCGWVEGVTEGLPDEPVCLCDNGKVIKFNSMGLLDDE